MYKALIFDWDGTVINSTARIVSSMRQAAIDLELADLSEASVMNIIGLGLPEAIKQLIPSATQADIDAMRIKYGHYYMGADKTEACLFDGAYDSLVRLKEQGYILAVATGKSRKGLDKVLQETQTGHLFTVTRCADETKSKPDPLMLQQILDELAVEPSSALMIGDTEYDLEMGRRAGLPLVATSYGAHAVERLTPYEPLLVMDKFVDLEHWLTSL